MKKRKERGGARRFVVFVAVVAVLAIVASITVTLVRNRHTVAGSGTVESDTTFVIGLTDTPSSLDIRTDSDAGIEQALLANVYETLVARDNDNNLVAGLAQRWDVADNGLTYTFHLHSGMRFANGDSLDAGDVVWSLQQIVSNKYVGYDELGSLASVSNPDDDTVVIKLSSPNPRLLRALSGRAGIVYDRAVESSLDYASQAAGSGPFTVASFGDGKLVLQRNARYWGTAAKASQITLKYYDNETALVSDLNDNVINMALPTRASSIEDAQSNPTFSVSTGVSCEKVLVGFNNASSSILSDVQVRQAVRYALDAEQIAKDQPDANAELSGPIGQLEPGYEDLDDLFPHDVAKARSMLSYFYASYLGTLDLIVPYRYEELGQTIEQNLEEAGLRVQLETIDAATLDQRVADGDFDLALMTMDEPGDYSAFATGAAPFHYVNGQAQDAYKAALAATNDDDYVANLKKFARIVSEDAASGWLYTRKDFVVTKARLQGYPTNFTTRYLPLANLTR